MKILFVTPGLPYPPDTDGRTRTFNLLKGLSQRHEVSLFSLLHHDEDAQGIGPLKEFCTAVEVFRPDPEPNMRSSVVQRWREGPRTLTRCRSVRLSRRLSEISAIDFSVAHLDYLGLAAYARYLSTIPLVLGKQDIEWILRQRIVDHTTLPALGRLRAKVTTMRLRHYEGVVCRLFRSVVTVSDEDRRLLSRTNVGSEIAVVPNGVDTNYFHPAVDLEVQPNELLFAGSLFWWPNVDAILYFCTQILPLIEREIPDLRLTILGQGAPPEVMNLAENGRISVVGRVDDIRPYYARAAVVIVPLRAASGTRLRILEALAMARPVVSTVAGIEGLRVSSGEHLVTADTPAEFARMVITLLSNPVQSTTIGKQGRRLVEEIYQWPAIVSQLENVYSKAVAR